MPYNGFLGGGQIRYNWQSGIGVFGIEADIDGSSAKGSTTVVFLGNVAFVPNTSTYARQLTWLSTVRGRIGITAALNFLIYATGGLALGTRSTFGAGTPTAPIFAYAPVSTNVGLNTAQLLFKVDYRFHQAGPPRKLDTAGC